MQEASGLVGQIAPAAPGSLVTIERRTAAGWTAVAQSVTGADGSFSASFMVTEGRYRARVEPPALAGLATGVSPRLTVVFDE
jgi:hypothetical protein